MSSYYDAMQVCENGHKITDSYHDFPQHRQNHCSKCGAKTMHTCPECGEEIRGFYNVEDGFGGSGPKVPSNCHKCGKSYPWTKDEKFKEAQVTDDELDKFDIQVLKEIAHFKENKGWMATVLIELAFGENEEYEEPVKESTLKLLSLKYIKGPGDPDPDGTYDAYSITPQGKQFLEDSSNSLIKKERQVENHFHISHSNVAINSSEVMQSLSIDNRKIVEEKLKELNSAIEEKNPSKITKAFGYITDKAVDVAIALLVNGMNK